MAPQEQRRPDILNVSRKRCIVRESGTSLRDVNQLVNQCREMRRMMNSVKRRAVVSSACGVEASGGLPEACSQRRSVK
jgi:signal recognition particle GTPase